MHTFGPALVMGGDTPFVPNEIQVARPAPFEFLPPTAVMPLIAGPGAFLSKLPHFSNLSSPCPVCDKLGLESPQLPGSRASRAMR